MKGEGGGREATGAVNAVGQTRTEAPHCLWDS